MQKLADLPIAEKQVERVTERIGRERLDERAAAVAAFLSLPLASRFQAPANVTPPDLAVVMVDGGRMQVLDRRRPTAAGETAPAETPSTAAGETAPAETPSTAAGETAPAETPPADKLPAAAAEGEPEPEWDEEPPIHRAGRHWREDKVSLLLTMDSAVSAHDPCPEIPESFVDPLRIPRLVRELKKAAKATADDGEDAAEPEATEEALSSAEHYEPPAVQQRQVVASLSPWRSFAPLVAQAAWALGFQGAQRKAFVGDGSANNWCLQRRYFGSFVPILDFIHALSYVFAAAQAGRSFAVGWACYQQWIGWVWQGRVSEVIAALVQRQADLGVPAADEPETSPRQVVAKTLTYLQNQAERMRYDEYRRQGLPLTSSLMESVVKQVNQRLKGTEKFWSAAGGEAVLQLRADHLSDGAPLEAFWQRRQAAATGQNRHRRAG